MGIIPFIKGVRDAQNADILMPAYASMIGSNAKSCSSSNRTVAYFYGFKTKVKWDKIYHPQFINDDKHWTLL